MLIPHVPTIEAWVFSGIIFAFTQSAANPPGSYLQNEIYLFQKSMIRLLYENIKPTQIYLAPSGSMTKLCYWHTSTPCVKASYDYQLKDAANLFI